MYLGRAPRTKEALPDFRERCRVARHSRVFRGLTGSQRTPRDRGVTKMDNDSILITAFSIFRGHYEWLIMPFGLKNAPQIFQGKTNNIFSDYSDFIIVYIDDILICFSNKKDHENHLNTFITLCKEHDIVLSEKKVYIKKKEIKFLGMIIDSKGIRLQSHID